MLKSFLIYFYFDSEHWLDIMKKLLKILFLPVRKSIKENSRKHVYCYIKFFHYLCSKCLHQSLHEQHFPYDYIHSWKYQLLIFIWSHKLKACWWIRIGIFNEQCKRIDKSKYNMRILNVPPSTNMNNRLQMLLMIHVILRSAYYA